MKLFNLIPAPWRLAVMVGGGVVIAAILYFSLQSFFVGDAKVVADLTTGQGSAAIESGKDAVETVGDNQAGADETKGNVEGVQNDVDQANDTDSADSAGRDGLCEQFGLCD